eukprot:Lankesteria_metandrocarpae@DN5149_c0_g1_i4.p2
MNYRECVDTQISVVVDLQKSYYRASSHSTHTHTHTGQYRLSTAHTCNTIWSATDTLTLNTWMHKLTHRHCATNSSVRDAILLSISRTVVLYSYGYIRLVLVLMYRYKPT